MHYAGGTSPAARINVTRHTDGDSFILKTCSQGKRNTRASFSSRIGSVFWKGGLKISSRSVTILYFHRNRVKQHRGMIAVDWILRYRLNLLTTNCNSLCVHNWPSASRWPWSWTGWWWVWWGHSASRARHSGWRRPQSGSSASWSL